MTIRPRTEMPPDGLTTTAFIMKKNILFASLLIAITTICYAFFLYQAEKTDRAIIYERVRSAFTDEQLLKSAIPVYTYGLGSKKNLSGLDQLGESFFALMFMYQGKANHFLEALMSGYYQTADEGIVRTEMAQLCASSTPEQRSDTSVWKVIYKPRQWHGLKALVLPMLQYLEWAQITWIVTISTFFMFAVIWMQIMFLDKIIGLAYTAFNICAFYCSSVLFFGGITYSIPLLAVAFWNALWLALRMLPWQISRRAELLFITFGGTWLCFFFQQGGEEIYAMSFVAFVEIFLTKEKLSTVQLRRVIESWSYFLFGFLGSIICKHLLILTVSGSLEPLYELVQNMLYRASGTNDAGSKIGLFNIVYAQFYWYGIPAYGITLIHDIVYYSPIVGIALLATVALWLLILKFFKQSEKFTVLGVTLLGFLLILLPVPLRYMILRNHSDIHLFFVSRYVFIFAGTVYFFICWLLLNGKNFLPQRKMKTFSV